jgi:hypothetical protein
MLAAASTRIEHPPVSCEDPVSDRPLPTQRGFDEKLAGRRAECDGGGPVAGTHYAGRQDFAGTLTGEYIDHGDPPWRWYLMTNLSRKPENYTETSVWCESESVFFIDERER